MYQVDFKQVDSLPTRRHLGRKRDGSFDAALQASHANTKAYEASFLDQAAANAVLMKVRRAAQFLNLGLDSSVRPNDDGSVTLAFQARDRRPRKAKATPPVEQPAVVQEQSPVVEDQQPPVAPSQAPVDPEVIDL
jgi:hypothetical protein